MKLVAVACDRCGYALSDLQPVHVLVAHRIESEATLCVQCRSKVLEAAQPPKEKGAR